jgi:hypothetical protein
MSVTYYVALPFVKTEDGSAAGQAMECQSAPEANRKAEIMSRDPTNVGALSFMRSGDPSLGSFADAVVIKKFGDGPDNLDEL